MAKEAEKPADEALPSLSFTEDEIQKVANFTNYAYLNGTFEMKLGDMKKVSGMLNDMHAHIAKMEKYIFEFKRVLASKKAEK